MYCTDIPGLIERVVTEREMSVNTTDIHLGMDGGQGWLKLGLILTDRSKEENKGRACYSEVKHTLKNIFFYLILQRG